MQRCHILLVTILFSIITIYPPVHSQNTSLVDIHSELYTNLERWEGSGYLSPLPNIQPYGPAVVVNRLENMLLKNIPSNIRNTAEKYLDALSNPTVKINMAEELSIRTSEDGHNFNLSFLHPGFQWTPYQNENSIFWTELKYQLFLLDSENIPALPSGMRDKKEWIPDDSNFSLFSRLIQLRQSPLGIVSLSLLNNDKGILNIAIGSHRSSLGLSRRDNIIFSADTPSAGHFTLYYEHFLENTEFPRLSYSGQLSVLSATDDNGQGVYAEKYLVIHDFFCDFLPWFGFGLNETVIWGKRIELLYFIPLSSYFVNQGFLGFSDNSLLGFEFIFRPIHNIRIPLTLYIDDIHFNDITSFEFNTKYKLAVQAEVTWTPLLPFLDSLSFEYTAVMPYMYSHWDKRPQYFNEERGGIPNYSNYTHRGVNIGPGLEPNSDRWLLEWHAYPLNEHAIDCLQTFSFSTSIQLTRHGNASTGIIPGGTGNIFDSGYKGSTATFQRPYNDPSNQPYTRFLTQNSIEHNLQFSLQTYAIFTITDILDINIRIRYTHEEIWNAKTIQGARKSYNYFNFMVGVLN